MKLSRLLLSISALLLFSQLAHPAMGYANIKSLDSYIVAHDDQTICVDENGNGIIDDNEPCSDDGQVPDANGGE